MDHLTKDTITIIINQLYVVDFLKFRIASSKIWEYCQLFRKGGHGQGVQIITQIQYDNPISLNLTTKEDHYYDFLFKLGLREIIIQPYKHIHFDQYDENLDEFKYTIDKDVTFKKRDNLFEIDTYYMTIKDIKREYENNKHYQGPLYFFIKGRLMQINLIRPIVLSSKHFVIKEIQDDVTNSYINTEGKKEFILQAGMSHYDEIAIESIVARVGHQNSQVKAQHYMATYITYNLTKDLLSIDSFNIYSKLLSNVGFKVFQDMSVKDQIITVISSNNVSSFTFYFIILTTRNLTA
jgi:hypothetical protein